MTKTNRTSPSSVKKNSSNLADYLKRPAQTLKSYWKIDQAKHHLRAFVEQAWPLADPSDFVPNWHIDCICEHLEAVTHGDIRRLLITIPPRHTKSLLVSVFWPSWEWITDPALRWLFASYAESLAIRDNVKSRRLIQSAWYQTNWPHVKLEEDQNEKRKYETSAGGHRIAVGVGGSATGEGGDRLVVDDPHNVRDIESEVTRQTVLDWHDQVWSTRANDPKKTARVIIMQRSHCDDLAGHVLEQGGWEHLSIPAEFEGDKRKTCIGWRDPRTTEGELLWPQRFGPDQIAEQKVTLGSFGFAGQFQQSPVPRGGSIWKSEWFRHYRRADLPQKFDSVILSFDCSFKNTKSSDYVAGQMWGKRGGLFYLLEQVHGRMNFPETMNAIHLMRDHSRYPIYEILIEEAANGTGIIDMLKLGHAGIPGISGIIGIKATTSKEARASAVAPLFESGSVLLPMPDESPWIGDCMLEFVTFPSARHDDRVDSASQALLRLHVHGGLTGMFQWAKEEAEKLKLETQVGRITTRGGSKPVASLTPAIAAPVPAPTPPPTFYYAGKPSIVPAVCPNCQNPNLTAYASSWRCKCGASANEPTPEPKRIPPPTKEALELAHWQKQAAGFMDSLPMKPFRQQPVLPPAPDLCVCGAGLSRFNEFWRCNVCGASGSTEAT